MLDFLSSSMIREKTIDGTDIDRFILSDSPTEIAARVREVAMQHFGLRKGPIAKPKWWLGE
jgi:hypothetical protein